jgi:ribosomal protein L11 methyltransferase
VGTRFWFDPHPATPTSPPDGRIHLFVEPRQAFGTGSHESTQLVLLLLERIPVAGTAVLDVGTGSGILSLAARSLGAASAVGFDNDLDAVCVARQTVAAQRQELGVALFAGSTTAVRAGKRFDLILANLIPAQLEPLLSQLCAVMRDHGTLVISGLMVDQRTALEAELGRFGLRVEEALEAGEWIALRCRAS